MDPLTALSVTSSVLQIADFGSKILKEAYEIYVSKDGSTVARAGLRDQTERFRNLCEDQRGQPAPSFRLPSPQEQKLCKLCVECEAIAGELLDLLQNITTPERRSVRGSLSGSLKGISSRRKISSLREKLDEQKRMLTLQLLTVLNDPKSSILKSLNDLTKSSRANTSSLQAKLDDIKSHVDASAHGISDGRKLLESIQDLLRDTEKMNNIHQILSSLQFETMHLRHLAVEEAHAETFHWILEEHQLKDTPEVHFLDWLRRKNGIFWISGKAGSGKSTLMKFLCEQERTRNALQQWAGHDQVVVASHFFWSTGHELQRSQQGLLQTLLFEIFRQCPELALKISPSRWHATQTSQWLPWTRSELMQTLAALKNQKLISAAGAVRFCFFIDGLDEYEGDDQDICDILEDLASSNLIKLCVSSRPSPVFWNDLGTDTTVMLTLQELTRKDIQLFVENKLVAHHRYLALQQQENCPINLATDIIETAQGVFLWVSLVVKELLDSIQNCDMISDLQRRLRYIPTNLEEYIRRMFDDLNPFYQKQASQIFLLLMNYGSLPLLAFSILEYEDPDYYIKAPIMPIPEEERSKLESKLRARLHGRCKDLIEVSEGYHSREGLHNLHVSFIHRTVSDFLRDDSMHRELEHAGGPGFDVKAITYKGLLLHLKGFPRDDGSADLNDNFLNYVQKALVRLGQIDASQGKFEPALLMELDSITSTRFQDNHEPCKYPGGERQSVWQMYLACLIVDFRGQHAVLPSIRQQAITIAELLIEAGAEPRSTIPIKSSEWCWDVPPEIEGRKFSTEEALIEVFGSTDGGRLVELFKNRKPPEAPTLWRWIPWGTRTTK